MSVVFFAIHAMGWQGCISVILEWQGKLAVRRVIRMSVHVHSHVHAGICMNAQVPIGQNKEPSRDGEAGGKAAYVCFGPAAH